MVGLSGSSISLNSALGSMPAVPWKAREPKERADDDEQHGDTDAASCLVSLGLRPAAAAQTLADACRTLAAGRGAREARVEIGHADAFAV